MNSSKSATKFSRLEININRYLRLSILIQIIFCLFAAIYNSVWQLLSLGIKEYEFLWYLIDPIEKLDRDSKTFTYDVTMFFLLNTAKSFGKWMLALINFVAISLLVSIEMVKFVQGNFIEWDAEIFDVEKGLPAKA